jgi:hypothetical protein
MQNARPPAADPVIGDPLRESVDRVGALPRPPALSRTAAVVLSTAILVVVGIGDYVTEWYFLFDLFYLVPLALITVYAGRRGGMLMAFACTIVWAITLYPRGASILAGSSAPSNLIWVWNFATRFGVLAAFAWVLASQREELDNQRRLVAELNAALAQVARLRELLPICAWCKKIRDDSGYWKQLDGFLQEHDIATFTLGICPECEAKIRQEYARPKVP